MLSDYASTLLTRLSSTLSAMETGQTMGQRLNQARTAAGLTRPQLAKLVGLTRAAINQWEADTVKGIKPANLLKVCEVLNIEPWWLVFGEGRRDAATTTPQRKRDARWLAVSAALNTERGDELLAYLESRITLERAGLLPDPLKTD